MPDNRKICLFWAIAVFCWLTFLIPATSYAWHWIDLKVFYALNSPLGHSPFLRTFWSLANHKFADWIEDGVILALYLTAIFKAPKPLRKGKIAESLFCICLIALTIIFFNRLIFRDLLQIRRQSPSLFLSDAISLSDTITWITIKVASNKSFPGDHATTALLFGCSYAYLNRGRLGWIAIGYALFLCLPRLCVGAHWFTDIFIGSGSIVLLSMTLAFFTPFSQWALHSFGKLLHSLRLYCSQFSKRFFTES